MTSITTTPAQDALVTEISIAAPRERVFQALIDPNQVMRWWTGGECQIESFTLEPRPGGRWSYATKPSTRRVNGVSQFSCDGEVLEYDPPRLLSYTWVANWHERSEQRTVVRWELETIKNGTRLTVTHSGLADLPASRKDYAGGWPGVLRNLKQFVEIAHTSQ
jgi:uncharacterized protein YndB with AHSA1/START domain